MIINSQQRGGRPTKGKKNEEDQAWRVRVYRTVNTFRLECAVKAVPPPRLAIVKNDTEISHVVPTHVPPSYAAGYFLSAAFFIKLSKYTLFYRHCSF